MKGNRSHKNKLEKSCLVANCKKPSCEICPENKLSMICWICKQNVCCDYSVRTGLICLKCPICNFEYCVDLRMHIAGAFSVNSKYVEKIIKRFAKRATLK